MVQTGSWANRKDALQRFQLSVLLMQLQDQHAKNSSLLLKPLGQRSSLASTLAARSIALSVRSLDQPAFSLVVRLQVQLVFSLVERFRGQDAFALAVRLLGHP